MKGDFSRVTFNRSKHYNAVLFQQGRVLTDADLNEAQDIQQYRTETGTADVVGPWGTSKDNPGFTLAFDTAGNLTIGPGRFYVDGILCENDAAGVTYARQPYLPSPPDIKAALTAANTAAGLVVLDVFRRLRTPLDDPQLSDLALGGPDTTLRTETIWQVKVLPLQVAGLGQTQITSLNALRQQVETLRNQLAAATDAALKRRLRTELRVARRTLRTQARQAGLACNATYPEWTRLVTRNAAMAVQTPPLTGTSGPCDTAPGAGYQGQENQLYRVEVQKVDNTGRRSGATFKWSRENGSVTTLIEGIGSTTSGTATGAVLNVSSMGRDSNLGFNDNDWVELVDDEVEQRSQNRQLVQIRHAERATNQIELMAPVTVNFARHPKLRRWDLGAAGAADGIAMNTADNAWINIEQNIQVSFADGVYRPGDYWVFAARAATGKVDFPAGFQPPAGVQHHYARLGLVVLVGNNLQLLLDCRQMFPALTDIAASDVSFDGASCAEDVAEAQTVQEALEVLCQRTNGCGLAVAPAEGWERVFDDIANGQSAHICLQVGTYTLSDTVILANKGNITISGCGTGTRIVAATAEAALAFSACGDVTVRDLYAESGIVPGGTPRIDRNVIFAECPERNPGRPSPRLGHLNGTLTFQNCRSVTVTNVGLSCAARSRSTATCLTVRNTFQFAGGEGAPGAARIQHCDLVVGHMQTGILLINVPRSQVEDNTIAVAPRPQGFTVSKWVQDVVFRSMVRKFLVTKVMGGPATKEQPRNARVTFGDFVVSFDTSHSLRNSWQTLLNAQPPKAGQIQNTRDLQQYVKTLADRVLVSEGGDLEAFRNWWTLFEAETPTVASQGIAVGGRLATDVRIVNNTVRGALQGIHIGVSHCGATSQQPDTAGRVQITNNNMQILLPPIYARNRYGIFIGNADSVVIENNYLQLRRSTFTNQLYIEGVRIWGNLGALVLVRQNHLANVAETEQGRLVQRDGFSLGVRVNVLNNSATQTLWSARDNIVPFAQQRPVVLANTTRVETTPNYPA